MSSCLIRPATLRDARAIAELHSSAEAALLENPPPSLTPPELEKRQRFWREAVEFAEPHLQLACDGDKVVGMVGFDRSRDKGSAQTMGEIWSICVSPAFWGQGVGLALWDAAREGLLEEGCTNVSIWLGLSNDRALRFHELAGFKREPATARTAAAAGVRIQEIRLTRNL